MAMGLSYLYNDNSLSDPPVNIAICNRCVVSILNSCYTKHY